MTEGLRDRLRRVDRGVAAEAAAHRARMLREAASDEQARRRFLGVLLTIAVVLHAVAASVVPALR